MIWEKENESAEMGGTGLNKSVCCVYSLEAPQWGASNEYPQHMFSSGNMKNIDTFWLKKAPYQELWKEY